MLEKFKNKVKKTAESLLLQLVLLALAILIVNNKLIYLFLLVGMKNDRDPYRRSLLQAELGKVAAFLSKIPRDG